MKTFQPTQRNASVTQSEEIWERFSEASIWYFHMTAVIYEADFFETWVDMLIKKNPANTFRVEFRGMNKFVSSF